MRTFRAAPRMPATAARAATPASEAEAGLPLRAISNASGRALSDASIVLSGTEAAYRVAFSSAAARAAFSSTVPLGIERASMMRLKAAVSSSIRNISSSRTACPFSAMSENSSQRSSHPRLWAERLATMVARAAPNAPMQAETEPPPGAGDSDAVSLAKPFTDIRTSRSRAAASASSTMRYSITFSFGLNGFRSSSDMDLTAIFRISSSEMPLDRCCFPR